MSELLIVLGVLGAVGFFIVLVTAIVVVVYKIIDTDTCNHSYERVDTANDKKMVLVCRKCGKIKKLRK